MWSVFFAVPLNELQMAAEGRKIGQSGGTKARMNRKEKPVGALRT